MTQPHDSDARTPLPLAPRTDEAPADPGRRDALKAFGLVPLAATLGMGTPAMERVLRLHGAAVQPDAPPAAAAPRFFQPHEWATLRLLADYIIPKDARSGSATDAKAPEFVDFMLMDAETREPTRIAWRGGLAWLDRESHQRFGKTFVAAADAQRRQILDDIAWPKKARPEMSAGVAFFSRARDAIGAAFFSSAMGWRDLQYMGNVFNPGWKGCPKPALEKLGVSYEEYNASLERRRNGASTSTR